MATKPLKTLTFEGLNDTYTVPQVDATLSVTGGAADAKATGDALATKADKIGNIALAERLYGGDYSSEFEPYHSRQAPEGMGAKDETIVGGSLAWNQLSDDYLSTTMNGVDVSYNNGVVTFNGTNTGSEVRFTNWTRKVIENHVYLCTGVGLPNGSYVRYASGAINGNVYSDAYHATVFKGQISVSNTAVYVARASAGYEYTNVKFISHVIDLTTYFGSIIADYIYSLEQSSAGAGVAWVKRYIDLDTYHEYDAGSIQSVEGLVSHDVVGFNQWDEVSEQGYIDSAGNNVSSIAVIRSKNYIPIITNAVYYFKCPSASNVYATVFWYNSNKSLLAREQYVFNKTITPPENAKYLRFYMADPYGNTYNHDICINLSDPSRNGTYEPYEKHSYPLDSSITLRGVPKLVTDHIEFDGDKYHADGSVERRYGVVDLGTLNWIAVSGYTGIFQATLTGVKHCLNQNIGNALCSKYVVVSGNNLANVDKSIIAGMNNNNYVMVRDTAYTDATAFKAAMSGVYLVYELATPTTETATPFQSPMIVGATEEYVSDSVVPVGHESRYYEDVAKKVNGLPKDFSTLIAPAEVTFTATRNYSVGSYLIVKNQLYKVTSAISSGGTITPNSNVTATTIMAEILALA